MYKRGEQGNASDERALAVGSAATILAKLAKEITNCSASFETIPIISITIDFFFSNVKERLVRLDAIHFALGLHPSQAAKDRQTESVVRSDHL